MWILQPQPSATGSFILSSTMMMSKYSLQCILRPFPNERSDVGDNGTERQKSPTAVATLACFHTLPSEEAKDGRALRSLPSLRRSSRHTTIRSRASPNGEPTASTSLSPKRKNCQPSPSEPFTNKQSATRPCMSKSLYAKVHELPIHSRNTIIQLQKLSTGMEATPGPWHISTTWKSISSSAIPRQTNSWENAG